MKVIWAISGSFCNHTMICREVEAMRKKGYQITALLSENSATLDTRFGTHQELIRSLKEMTGQEVMTTLQQAETLGPHCDYDCMILAPCTSTVCSKLAYGDYDHTCTLAAKAMLRNQKPVILGIASNDMLGNTAEALFRLKQTKNIYLVPFFQDDPFKKPNSCISRWELIEKTMKLALQGCQLQPLLYTKEADYDCFG